MTELQEQILAAARHYVTDLFANQVKPEFVFHNLDHTEDVAEACSKMADHYHLNDDDRFVLMLAAWFHDVGYSSGQADGHEEVSMQIASRFLEEHQVDEATRQRVNSCIQATKMPQSPVTLIEKILCDADLSHLASPDYHARNQLLREERESQLRIKIPKKEWRKGNIQFLRQHQYFTDYGQAELEPGKQQNLNELKRKEKKVDMAQDKGEVFPYLPSTNMKPSPKALQKNADRGIQTMFRLVSGNHLRLSSMADNKAHIMISVNSIIISIVISVLFGKLSYYHEFTLPAAILLAVCLGSMTFAILATRPSVSAGRFTEEDIRNRKTNLLFFGNFYRMQENDYQWAMNQMMHDGEYLYNSMIKDVYSLGVVLARKYRYLRISYTIFMYGVIVAVVAFVVVAFIYNAGSSSASVPTIDY
jgi:predicted metal-dependent HD superfamily phosphohydrolase